MRIRAAWDKDRASRARLALGITPMGGILGFIAASMSFFARARPYDTLSHLSILPSMTLGIPGALAGLLASAVIARFEGTEWIRPRALYVWCLWGLAYGIAVPFLTGAFLPFTTLILLFASGEMGLAQFGRDLLDSFFKMIWSAFIQGVIGIPSGLVTGTLFGIGSWLVDTLGSPHKTEPSRLLPFATGLFLAMLFLFLFYAIPISWISRLGWGPG